MSIIGIIIKGCSSKKSLHSSNNRLIGESLESLLSDYNLIVDKENDFEITPDIWIISDTHFFHENIGIYCSRPDNWQDLIIKNWNALVSPDEPVLHLGDFALGKKSNFELLTNMLNGKIYLIRGNHDRLGRTYCETHGVTLVNDPLLVEYGDHIKLAFSHRPIVPLPDGIINLHGHIHNNPPPPEGSGLRSNHINMSVEVREYRPWRLSEIVKLG